LPSRVVGLYDAIASDFGSTIDAKNPHWPECNALMPIPARPIASTDGVAQGRAGEAGFPPLPCPGFPSGRRNKACSAHPPSPKRNGGLDTMSRPSPVICGYWTKAIALPRMPGIPLLFSSQAAIALWRSPKGRVPRRRFASRWWNHHHPARGCKSNA
jgi:hypothetical protein